MKQLALALALFASTPVDAAACHRHAIWHYPWPQRCGVGGPRFIKVHQASSKLARPHRPTSEPDIALPGLARADVDGGEADDEAKGRLLLRAALEVVHAH
jgi:hypothetical protein